MNAKYKFKIDLSAPFEKLLYFECKFICIIGKLHHGSDRWDMPTTQTMV